MAYPSAGAAHDHRWLREHVTVLTALSVGDEHFDAARDVAFAGMELRSSTDPLADAKADGLLALACSMYLGALADRAEEMGIDPAPVLSVMTGSHIKNLPRSGRAVRSPH